MSDVQLKASVETQREEARRSSGGMGAFVRQLELELTWRAIDDGTLDLYSLEMRNLWKLALMMRAFRSGTHGAWKEVRTAKCVEFDIETRRPMPINTDGEIVTATPAKFRVLPRAIAVLAPEDGPATPRSFPLYHR